MAKFTGVLDKVLAMALISHIKDALRGKVSTEAGKGLSTNDLTDPLKSRYDATATAVENGNYQSAQNVQDIVTGYGFQNASQVEGAITNKGYQTEGQVQTAITSKGYLDADGVQQIVDGAVAGVTGIDFQKVDVLPTIGQKGIIYLVLATTAEEGGIYNEYIWVVVDGEGHFEPIGTTAVDLSGFLEDSDITVLTEAELAAMWDA